MIGDPGSEHHRARVGFLFLAVGILLLLWAWGSWFYRVSMPPQAEMVAREAPDRAADGSGEAGPAAPEKTAGAFSLFLLVGTILVLAFFIGSYLLLRIGRRYRAVADRERGPPSDTRDVWSMHRVPEYDDYDDNDDLERSERP